jgi:hypothetical protein
MQGYPPPGHPGGYRPPARTGMSPLVIVLIVLGVLLVLGAGSCLVCVGLAASIDDPNKSDADVTSTTTPAGLARDALSRDLETKLRAQGIPATTVMCPPTRGKTFTCELAINADRAPLEVKDTGSGYSFDVPNTAFLDGAKLAASFQTTIAAKVDPRLRVPCFTGTLMKKVGSAFDCDVLAGAVKSGTLTVTVQDAKGNVKMDYTAQGTPATPTPTPTKAPARTGPRVVDFVCPAGKAPGGAVRGGCVCGSEILGTACGAPGNFTDVVETPRGCRFTCD